jgi:molybdenum cofactor cytidylyltransferase
MSEFRCAAVVLAAGASSRLGHPKQLVRIQGESLLHRTARLALEAGCSPAYIVVGFEAEAMREELLDLPVETVLNTGWREGLGSSVRAGINEVREADSGLDAVLLMVCDQPQLTAGHLRDLVARQRALHVEGKKAITGSLYAGKAGVPAVFPRALFAAIATCSGDTGAREVLRAHAADVETIPWAGGELDLDWPEDLSAIER